MGKTRPRSKAKRPKARKPPRKFTAKTPGNATPVKELERLARLADTCKSRAQTATSQIGGEIKAAVENKHLHAKAFRAVLAERRMGSDDPIKLRDYMAACEYYRDALKIEALKADDMMVAKPKKSAGRARSKDRSGEGLKPLGSAAGNVVTLAGAMKDAIDKDKAAEPKEMEVA